MGGKEFSQNVQEFFENCRKGDQEKVNAWIQSRNRKSKSPLNFLRPTTPCLGWLSSIRDPCNSYTALHLASLNGHLEITKTLLEHDPQLIGTKDKRGCLPIHLAAWNGHYAIVQQFLTIDPTLVDVTNNAKECPLHLAAQHGHAKIVSFLLQRHADARLRNARYETPLDIAARTGKESVCRLLICHCPELALQSAAECSTANNQTISSYVVYPLHSAARYGHLECVEVLCHAGFDVNYATEEGTALHVAALFGRLEVVQMLLDSGVNINIKDSQGKTVLEKLKEHENQKASDITQVIQSREGWSACREAIESFLNEYPTGVKPMNHTFSQSYQNFSKTNQPQARDVVWRTIPENSLAARNSPRSQHRSFDNSYLSATIYHPPSMTVDHVILEQPLMECDQASTISLSTTLVSDLNNTLERSCIETESGGSSVSPSIASTSSQRHTPKFPLTSPNTKNRHISSRRSANHSLMNQSVLDPIPSNKNDITGCSYQAPPLYDSMTTAPQAQQKPYTNIIDANPRLPMSYDNVPRNLLVYDNAPIGHRRWDHNCQNHSSIQSIGVVNGKNVTNNLVREDGTQTVPITSGHLKRPTILTETFKKPSKEKFTVDTTNQNSSKHDVLRESIVEELDTFLPYEKFAENRSSAVTFSFSTLERSVSPERRIRQLDSHAPLALPEEISGSTCTSLLSMSPDRHLQHNENRMRRSASSDNRTILSSCENALSKSMHPIATNNSFELINEHLLVQNLVSNDDQSISVPHKASTLVSPDTSAGTAASSCSLPFMISQISSSPSSTTSLNKQNELNEDLLSDKEVPPMIPRRANKTSPHNKPSETKIFRKENSINSDVDRSTINQSLEWKKIEDMISAIRRDSLFADNNGSPVAISVRNRKSQALTLQLSSLSANLTKNETCSSNSDIISTDGDSGNDHAEPPLTVPNWLQQSAGLPKARSLEIGKLLEKNGFDRIEFMKGTINKRTMTEIGIDKSIQYQILSSLEIMHCLIPSIEEYEYTSDWLNALALIDYLGSFVNQNLTQPKSVLHAKLTSNDLKKMGIILVGHLERILFSLNIAKDKHKEEQINSSLTTLSTSSSNKKSASTHLYNSSQQTDDGITSMDDINFTQKTSMLLHKCLSYSAHYLGAVEISNVEGAEDCRRAISSSKIRIRQIIKVPQVLLEISVGGVNILDGASRQLIAQHEVNRIQVVCQDEWDLNCFAYIFQDGDKNICHVYCVLTADMAKDIIMTLGHAFNLAYSLALGGTSTG